MARKKDLHGEIMKGADRFFSVNDAQEAQGAEDVGQDKQPHRAQDVTQERLAEEVTAMQKAIDAAEARKTQGRKGLKMPRLNISLTPSGMEYVRVMAGITGKSVTRYISDMVDKDAEENAERYQKAREIMHDGR